MTSSRAFASLVLLFALLTLGCPSGARAEQPTADGDDWLTTSMLTASFSAGIFAFDLGVALEQDEAFGPSELRGASLMLGVAGLVGTHVAAFALLSADMRRSPRARTILGGISLFSGGLSFLSMSLTGGYAIFTSPLQGDQWVAVAAPVLLGVIGVAGMIAGSVVIAGADDAVQVSLSASPTGASIGFSGTW